MCMRLFLCLIALRALFLPSVQDSKIVMEAGHSIFDTMRDVEAIAACLNGFRQLSLLVPFYDVGLLALNPSQRHKAEMKLGKPSCVRIASAMGLEHSVGFNSSIHTSIRVVDIFSFFWYG